MRSRRFQDVFGTSSKSIFKKSTGQIQDVFKTSSRCIGKMFSKHLQDVLKTYHQVKLLLLRHLQDIFETYSIRFWDVLQRRLFTERFTSDKFTVRIQNLQEWNLLNIPKLLKQFFKNTLWSDYSTKKYIIVKVRYQERCSCLTKQGINE